MVDTPKEGNGDEIAEDDPSKKQPKRRRQRRHSKSHHSKSSDTGTRDNNTPNSAKTTTIPSSMMYSGRVNKIALQSRQQMKNRRRTITCLSPKTR